MAQNNSQIRKVHSGGITHEADAESLPGRCPHQLKRWMNQAIKTLCHKHLNHNFPLSESMLIKNYSMIWFLKSTEEIRAT